MTWARIPLAVVALAVVAAASAAGAACDGPPARVNRCVEGWPAAPSAPSAAPLPDMTPGVAWVRPVSRATASDGLALTADRIALSVGARLVLLDHDGRVVADQVSSGYERLSSPVADDAGNFYVAGASVYAVDADARWRWIAPLPEAAGRTLVLDPTGGTLYTAAGDGYLYAIAVADGALRWRRQIGENPLTPAAVLGGVGNAVLAIARADGEAPQLFDAATGAVLARWPTYGVFFGGELGIVTQRLVDGEGSWPRMHIAVLDACSHPRWDLAPARPQWPVLVAPGDRLLVAERDPADDGATYVSVYAPDGRREAGPTPADVPWVIGADGTIYGIHCEGSGWDGPARLTAYDAALAERWRIELGPGCPTSGPALADAGLLVFARFLPETGITEVVAVQTASPGLAATSWPVRRRDNAGTSWLR